MKLINSVAVGAAAVLVATNSVLAQVCPVAPAGACVCEINVDTGKKSIDCSDLGLTDLEDLTPSVWTDVTHLDLGMLPNQLYFLLFSRFFTSTNFLCSGLVSLHTHR